MKTTAILTFKDSKNAYLRFFEAVIGAAFLALVTLVADIKEAGYGAILIVLIPILLIIDSLVRFFCLKGRHCARSSKRYDQLPEELQQGDSEYCRYLFGYLFQNAAQRSAAWSNGIQLRCTPAWKFRAQDSCSLIEKSA